jgi:hypothetical protein
MIVELFFTGGTAGLSFGFSASDTAYRHMRYTRIALVLVGLALLQPEATAQQPGDCGYYVNRDGQTVPRPCGNYREERPPHGATAICRDGDYSYSRTAVGHAPGMAGCELGFVSTEVVRRGIFQHRCCATESM